MSGKGQGSALKEALEKWKKDQARNQALQTQIADDRAKKGKKKESKAKDSKARAAGKQGAKATPSPAASDGPVDMKAQLRTVIKTRKSAIPLSKQIKDSLDALQRAQEPLTAAELQQLTGHDCSSDGQLAELLAANQKIDYKNGKYRFKAAAEVKVCDREGALKFVQSSKGCLLRDLTAAYPAAADDVAQLRSEGHVWVLPAAEKEQKAVFAREHPPMISVSTDVMKLWHQVEVSEDPEEQARELKRANIVSAVQRGKRERPKPAKKEKKKRAVNFDRYTRITNDHMPELFMGAAATSID